MPKDSQGRWDEHTKREAIAAWIIHGSLRQASELTGMPVATIQRMKAAQPEYFNRIANDVMNEVGEDMKHRYSRMGDIATRQILDRLENGEPQLTPKGRTTRKPLSVQTLIRIMDMVTGRTKALNEHKPAEVVETDQKTAAIIEQMRKSVADRTDEALADPDSNVEKIS